MSSILNKIKSRANMFERKNKLCSIKQLKLKTKYNIVNARRCRTQYGDQILVELENCNVFLPKRCARDFDDEAVSELPKLALEVVEPMNSSFILDFHEKEQEINEVEVTLPSIESAFSSSSTPSSDFANTQKHIFYNSLY